MKELLEQNNLLKPPKVGDIVEGTVVATERRAVFLDLGIAGTGVIYGRELLEAKDILRDVKPGDKLMAKIVELKNDEGYLELSVAQAGKELTWEELKQKKEKSELLKIKIVGANKGGLLTEIAGISGFLPVSQLSLANYPKVEGGETGKILIELQKFVGQELEVQVFDLDPKAQRLILSERAKEADKVQELLKNYKVGDVVQGEISGMVDFGAFFKFNQDLEGLIHISELDWKIITHPSEVVKVGQEVKAKIIDLALDKVFLSLKALQQDPWQDVDQQYQKGDTVAGKVTKLNHFGAFVQITPEFQGLCHISEFGSYQTMEERLKVGETYDFQILELRSQEHKISLKLVQAA